MPFNLGGALGVAGGAAPSLQDAANRIHQNNQKAAALKLMMQLNGQQQQAPGGVQPAPANALPWQQPPASPTGSAPTSPVAGLPGAQSTGVSAPGGMPDMSTIMATMAKMPGSDADKWDAMSQVMPIYGEQLKARIEQQKEARQQAHDEWMEKSNMELRKLEAARGGREERRLEDLDSKPESLTQDPTYKALTNNLELARQEVVNGIGDHDKAMAEYNRLNKLVSEYTKKNSGTKPVAAAKAKPAPKASTASEIPQEAIDALKSAPETAEQFNEIFGEGSAAKVLGK